MTTFVDTSAFFALVDESDDHHARARAVFERIGETEELVTHQYVVVETIALAQRRLPPAAVRELVMKLLPVVAMQPVDEATHVAGTAALLSALPSRRSFIDLVSFEFMREHGISTAFAFDADFERAGFATLS